MAMKKYSNFAGAPELENHYQMVSVYVLDSRWGGGLTPLPRCSRRILQHQQTALLGVWVRVVIPPEELPTMH